MQETRLKPECPFRRGRVFRVQIMQPQDIAVHIDSMKERFEELEEKLAAPEIYSKPAECKALSRERQCLAGIFKAFELWNRTL